MATLEEFRQVRLEKLQKLQSLEIETFPARSKRTHTCGDILNKFDELEGQTAFVVGRIKSLRGHGVITFWDIADETGEIQLFIKQENIENFYDNLKLFDLGDFIQASGEIVRTKTGQISIMVEDLKLLTKSLRPLPNEHFGLKDEEARYRRRYLDFNINPDQREKIVVRGKVLRYLREFLQDQGFIEVETPILETVSSGAMAKTFDSHLNAYDLDVHLRICAGELWQKRLLVGGFEKVFDMGRAFRNEGVDRQHNPEFTMLEYYWAFADYEDNMRMHEEMIPYVIKNSIGTLQFEHDDNQLDFTPPYPKVMFHDIVLQHSGIDLNDFPTAETLAAEMEKRGYSTEGVTERGKLIDELFKATTRPKIIQPTFVLNYPIELKPLAKKSEDSRYTEMFQLIVNGFELSNSYTELNDPIDQRERFEGQIKNKEEGDEEAMSNDWDYVEALEYGMPPATGTGIGIDRFAALITGSRTLREVIAFPLMKPVDQLSADGGQLTAENHSFEGVAKNVRRIHSVEEDSVEEQSEHKEDSFKQDLSKKIVIIVNNELENWKVLNSIGHVSAYLGHKIDENFFSGPEFETEDGESFDRSCQYPVVVLSAKPGQFAHLREQLKESDLMFYEFLKEHLEVQKDEDIAEVLADKDVDDLQHYAIGMFGDKEKIDSLTKKFSLWK